MHIEFFSQQNDFDEGVFILWPFFWGNVNFKICHFCLNSHNIDVPKISIVWLPRARIYFSKTVLLWRLY